MSIFETLDETENLVISSFRLVEETLNELSNLPDTNANRIKQLAQSYFETVKKIRTSLYDAHNSVRSSAEIELKEKTQRDPQHLVFDFDSALEHLFSINGKEN